MKDAGVAFDVLEAHENVPVGWTKASRHLILGCQYGLYLESQMG